MMNLLVSIMIAGVLFPSGVPYLQALGGEHTDTPSVAVTAPRRVPGSSLGLGTTADAIVVVDDASGAILYNEHYLKSLPIASITKLLTALVVLDTHPDWDALVEITAEDQRVGNQVYLLPGEQVSRRDLFNVALVGSANEAAAALARTSGIENFVQAMNDKARSLGMVSARFTEPTGLDPANVAAAHDLSKLAQAAFGAAEIAEAATTSRYTFTITTTGRQRTVQNTNALLDSFLNSGDYAITGAKTGSLDEAGYCLVLQLQKKDGPAITVVLLGSDSQEARWQEAKGIVDWVFENYQWLE